MKNPQDIATLETRIQLTDEQKEQILQLIKESKSTNFRVEIQFEADLAKRTIVPATVMVGMAI